MDVITNIHALYDSLSRTQRHIADYVLEHTHAVSFMSLRELSREVGTSESTILSFCGKLECQNFLGLKRDLREYLKRWVSPNEKIKITAGQLDADERSLAKIIDTDCSCLTRTFDYLNMEELRLFVAALKRADRIHVVGHGVSATVAMYLQVRLQQIGYRANGLNILDHRAVVYEAANAGANDVFVIIAFPNYAPQTVALVDYLVEVRAHAVCITDRASSPVARNAEAVLLCNTDNIIFYNSMTAPMAMVNLICSALVLDSHDKFAGHLDKLDSIENFLRIAQAAYDEEMPEDPVPRSIRHHSAAHRDSYGL